MAITEIEDHISDIINQDNHEQFIYDFLSVYDFPKATITKLRKGTNNLAKESGEVYLKNRLYFKQTNSELMQSFVDVKEKVDQLGAKPRYIMVTNFKNVLAEDTKTGDTLDVEFERLPQKFEFFLAWNGIEKTDFDKENPADIRAAERFAKLYDVVVKDNPNATRHGLNLFLIRVLFCLFAEDTDIFAKNLFTNRLKELTKQDDSDLDVFIDQLFGVLDIEKDKRPADTPSWLADFPYVDGDLFKDPHEHLKFTEHTRKLIIDAGEKLEWDQINPDILGSMIQAVASEDSRSHLGMHYTSVPNIMKVIKPLFLDDLRQAFEDAKGNETKLNELYDRIGKIKFMDPACGSGNFLIITYKELRQLEIDILKELNQMGIATMYVPSVTLDQFYGIEIDDFACDVTRLSLWIAEHQMNKQLHKEIDNAVRPTLPLQHAGAIVCGNALEIDWGRVMTLAKGDQAYLFGNPPYLGAKKQSDLQKKQLNEALGSNFNYRKLDYICGWFVKATRLIKQFSNSKVAFVSTNSICQGEQVALLWPDILRDVVINFAYTSFDWSNNAKNVAGITVIIIGLSNKNGNDIQNKKIFESNSYKLVSNISPYLTDGESNIVKPLKAQINGFPEMYLGSMPRDGGNLILSREDGKQLISSGISKKIVREYIGASEFVNGKYRYCLWMDRNDYESNKQNDLIRSRVEQVAAYRRNAKAKSTQKYANLPWTFVQKGEYDKAYGKSGHGKLTLIVPKVTTENRLYIPMGIIDGDVIVSDLGLVIYNSPIWLLGLLESKMHMVWLKSIGGKFRTGYRYSSTLVYNTFPVPDLSTRRKNEIEDLVLKILDIRDEEGGTLAELYGSPLAAKNPKPMNPCLLAAHQELDQVVDRAYRDRPFKDDNERLSLLLDMYSQKVNEAK